MKKALITFVIAAVMMMSVGIFVSAETVADGSFGQNLTWSLDSDGTLTIKGDGQMDSYSDMTGVYPPWNEYCSMITDVVIDGDIIGVNGLYDTDFYGSMDNYENGVLYAGEYLLTVSNDYLGVLHVKDGTTHIANFAAGDHYGITGISIPDSVTNIDDWAFKGCKNAEFLSLGKNVKNIGRNTFAQCNKLKDISVDEENEYYVTDKYGVLMNKDETTLLLYPINSVWSEYKVPETVETIAAFSVQYDVVSGIYDKNIKRFIIGDNVKNIDDWAFGNVGSEVVSCYSKTYYFVVDKNSAAEKYAIKMEIPYIYSDETVMAEGECGDNLFWLYTDSGKLIIYGVGEMYDYQSEDDLPWIDVSETVKLFVIANEVSRVSDMVLSEMYELEKIVISNTVCEFYNSAIDCYCLEEVEVDKNNSRYYAIDGVLFDKQVKSLEIYPSAKEDEYYKIPDEVKVLNDICFSNKHNLKQVEFNDSISSVPDSCFGMNYVIEKVVLGKNVKYIGAGAFWKCWNLKEIVIPEGLTVIDSGAFEECTALRKVILPESTEKIGALAFYKCSALEAIYIPEGVTEIGKDVFECGAFAKYEDFTIYGVSGSVAESYAEEYGYKFADINENQEIFTDEETDEENNVVETPDFEEGEENAENVEEDNDGDDGDDDDKASTVENGNGLTVLLIMIIVVLVAAIIVLVVVILNKSKKL